MVFVFVMLASQALTSPEVLASADDSDQPAKSVTTPHHSDKDNQINVHRSLRSPEQEDNEVLL